MEYSPKGLFLYSHQEEAVLYPHIQGTSSMMKILIDVEKDIKKYPELTELKSFLNGERSFELLSPDQMRSSSRGKSTSLSMSGRNLPSFLKNMTDVEKKSFINTLQKLLGDRIEDVSTEIQKNLDGHM